MTTQTYRRARHSVSALHAHLVFVTKYRRPVFTDEMLTFAEHTMRTVCSDLDVELVEFNGETDHAPSRRLPTHHGNLDTPTAPERTHRPRGATRIHRPLCPRPHPRTPLVAVPLRRLLRRRTTVHHQAIHPRTSPTRFERPATPSDTRDGLTPD